MSSDTIMDMKYEIIEKLDSLPDGPITEFFKWKINGLIDDLEQDEYSPTWLHMRELLKDVENYPESLDKYDIPRNINEDFEGFEIDESPEYPIKFADKIIETELSDYFYEAEETGDISHAIDLLWLYYFDTDILRKKLLYSSGRPRTTMKNFPIRTVQNIVFPLDQSGIITSYDMTHKFRVIDETISIPVTRYGTIETGMFYTNVSPEKQCGTFYYFEPESPFYLTSRKTLIALNKVMATFHLWNYEDMVKFVRKNCKDYFTDNAYMLEILDMIDKSPSFYYKRYEQIAGGDAGFDQILCNLAREKGFDVVVIGRAAGKHTYDNIEIMDVRDRNVSYQNLVTLER